MNRHDEILHKNKKTPQKFQIFSFKSPIEDSTPKVHFLIELTETLIRQKNLPN